MGTATEGRRAMLDGVALLGWDGDGRGVQQLANNRMHLTRSAPANGTAVLAGDPECSTGQEGGSRT